MNNIKTGKLKNLLTRKDISFLMEAHNALSAKVAEEAGYEGLWGSSLTISGQLGVRDSNEASWTQVLEVVEFMSDATKAPILLDADTGYGNFNNVRRLVKKVEQRDIAGICLEDKLFPKTNSFINSERQPLADIDEFSGKIKAAKDAQSQRDFCVVARIESFIAGWGLKETLRRAEAYHRAGADALLIHSRKSTADEILEFMKHWKDTCPVVIVPTKYYQTPTSIFESAGVSTVIWANHLLRASITAMQTVARRIHKEQMLVNIEDEIAPVTEVFRLQGSAELEAAEKRYLPQDSPPQAVILAATRGEALGNLTADKPKTMVEILGEPILVKLVRQFNDCQIKDIITVLGYKPEAVQIPGIKKVINKDYATTKEAGSLAVALESVGNNPLVFSFGDIVFKRHILGQLLDNAGDIVIAVDPERSRNEQIDTYREVVRCNRAFKPIYNEHDVELLEMNPSLGPSEISGEFMGLATFSAKGVAALKEVVRLLQSRPGFSDVRMKDVFNELVRNKMKVSVEYVSGNWLDVDDVTVFDSTKDF